MASLWWQESFMWQALLGGLLLVLLLAPLGCVVAWRRMAYFSDAMAHASLLGLAVGALFHVSGLPAMMLSSLLFAGAIYALQRRGAMSSDSALGFISHSALAAGVVLLSLLPPTGNSMTAILLGDILAISETDIQMLAISCVLMSGFFWWAWPRIVLWSLNEELAVAEGVATQRLHVLVLFCMALMMGLAIPMVGVLMVGAMLIIPAAAARMASQTPWHMLLGTALVGALGVVGGLAISWEADVPAGPAMVLVQATLLLGIWGVKKCVR